MNIVFLEDAFENEEKNGILWKDILSKGSKYSPVILRSWMLSEKQYEKVENDLNTKGFKLLVNTKQYALSHFLPRWYPHFKEQTFETFVFSNDDSINHWLEETDWKEFFIKDEVKSLTTSRGSVARNKKEVWEIINLLRYFGSDGDICIRKYHKLINETEKRHFVFEGKIYSENETHLNKEIKTLVENFACPFFSFDTIEDTKGKQWIVEIGNGQVSSFKWKEDAINNFYSILKGDKYESKLSC